MAEEEFSPIYSLTAGRSYFLFMCIEGDGVFVEIDSLVDCLGTSVSDFDDFIKCFLDKDEEYKYLFTTSLVEKSNGTPVIKNLIWVEVEDVSRYLINCLDPSMYPPEVIAMAEEILMTSFCRLLRIASIDEELFVEDHPPYGGSF